MARDGFSYSSDQLKRDADKVSAELDSRLRANLRKTGDFSRVHPLPRSGADVPDDLDAQLVVLPPEHPFSKENGSPAEKAAREILESRGNAPRLYRTTLVFLAADKVRMQDLDEALRKYLAWAFILAEKETLDLSPFQVRQAADAAVTARLPETYQWVLAPEQKTPEARSRGWRSGSRARTRSRRAPERGSGATSSSSRASARRS